MLALYKLLVYKKRSRIKGSMPKVVIQCKSANLSSAAEHGRPGVDTAKVFLQLRNQLLLILHRRKRLAVLLLQLAVATWQSYNAHSSSAEHARFSEVTGLLERCVFRPH